MTRFLGVLMLVSAMLWSGCGGGGTPTGEGDQKAGETGAAAPVQVQNPATVKGSIQFTGTAPKAKTISMAADAYCKVQHSGTVSSDEVVVNPNGTLKYAYVYVKSGLGDRSFPPPSQAAVLDQKGCLYTPHVLAVQTKQPVIIKNSDGVLHNVNARPKSNKGFNIGQPVQGMETTKTFDNPEIAVPLKCDVHPWMNAYIHVQNHPYFAVTGDDGSFTIPNLPAGTYELEAWHEKFGTATQTVTVGDNETKTVSFGFKGA